ncbi:hypothetical protein [Pseudomonas sp. NBRC 111142]|uniref:hypothetical protein n=1 Tax=Pseudomonas sp. NBRC 111142 TaxID=1661057 RepID=UPI0006D3F2C8|nr:hypothetical protein [Pseudomonas sp. NBRC 111142]
MDIHQSLKAALTKLKLDFSLMMITCAGVFVVVVISAYVVNFFGWFSSSKEVWGQFGDYVGGVLNPVLSFMALIAVVKSLKYQSEEVKEARSEASAAISMQKEQTKIFKQQSFESVFFGLIDLYSKALETMSLYEEQRVFTGIAVAQRLSFKYNVDRIDWIFNESKGNLTRREREFLFRGHANKMLAAAQENGLKFFTILE